MSRARALREAAQQNRNEHTDAYLVTNAGRGRWQVRRQEDDGTLTLISQ